jgi:hypothetical protein
MQVRVTAVEPGVLCRTSPGPESSGPGSRTIRRLHVHALPAETGQFFHVTLAGAARAHLVLFGDQWPDAAGARRAAAAVQTAEPESFVSFVSGEVSTLVDGAEARLAEVHSEGPPHEVAVAVAAVGRSGASREGDPFRVRVSGRAWTVRRTGDDGYDVAPEDAADSFQNELE